MYARVFHKRSRGIYGYRKVYEDFRREVTGIQCSCETLRKIMSANHLFSCVKSRHKYHRIEKDKVYKYPNNILSRDFKSHERNKKWVGDITYIWTNEGWLYLAVVMDLYSRKIIGWSMSKDANSDLACKALNNALMHRNSVGELLYHSDRGVQYSSYEFQKLLKDNGITGSMSYKADPWSNAVQENFFQKLKQEYIKDRNFINIAEAKKEVFWYIEIFYNNRRRHKYLGYLSPSEYEKKHEVVA